MPVKSILVHLMRHGLPLRPGLLLGHTDDPPAPAARLPVLPDGLALHRVISSDLQRARCLATVLATARRVPLALDSRWRELDFGLWDGLAPGTVEPAALARFHDDPDAAPPPGGESWSALRARVGQAVRALADATLVVTHAGAMRAALAVLTGLDHRGVWAVDLPYGSLLSLRIWPSAEPAGQIVGLRSHDPA